MRLRLFAILTVLVLVLVAASACGSGGTDGESLVDEKCTTCHGLEQIDMADYDAATWESTVERMINKGTELTDEEAAAIVDYLATR